MKPNPPLPKNQLSPESPRSWVREFTDFVLHNKKWWLTPIFLVLLLASLLVVLGGSGVAPFIYSLF